VKLELTRRGDYAIRAGIALAEADGGRLNAQAISRRMRIPASFVPQVMADLSRAGVARATLGRGDGYRLARPPSMISLLEIMEAAEGPSGRRTCLVRGVPCGQAGRCQAHHVFASAQHALLDVLRTTTLRDVTRPQSAPAAQPRDESPVGS
jgi:Rrf2 family protein